MGMTVEAVLFDIDGTLVDSNGWHVQAWDEAFRIHGYPQATEAIAGQIGKGGDLLVPTLAPEAPADVSKALAAEHGAIFKQRYLTRVEPFPQARALIERVHRDGKRVVLASSASREELDHYVALLGIADLVDAAITADDVETSKPAPDIFGEALARAGVSADRARAIGDSPYDIEAARGAGVRTLAVLSGGFPRERLAAAEAIFRDVGDLLDQYRETVLGR